GSFHRAHAKLPTIVYVYPREGLNLWGDNFAVPKGAKHVENAKLFLNFMMDPKNAAEASNFTGYNNAIAGAEQYLKDDLRSDPALNPPEAWAAGFGPFQLAPRGAPDRRERIWPRLLR